MGNEYSEPVTSLEKEQIKDDFDQLIIEYSTIMKRLNADEVKSIKKGRIYPFEITENNTLLLVAIFNDYGLSVRIGQNIPENRVKLHIQAIRDLQRLLSVYYNSRKIERWNREQWIYFIEHCRYIKLNMEGMDYSYSNKVVS